MKHLSEKKLIAFILDITDSKSKARTEEHLDACGECRNRYSIISSVFTPQNGINIPLSENLRQRILNSASQVHISGIKTHDKINVLSKILTHKTLIGGLSAAAAAIIIAIVLLMPDEERAYFRVDDIYGNADIDAVPASTHDLVGQGHTISTGDHSAMILKLSNDHRLILMGKSDLTIENAELKNDNVEVAYTLDKGTLLNRHDRNDVSAKYAIDTPHALINAQDADLILKASGKHSSIMLLNGRIFIKNKKSSNAVMVDSPGKYVVSDNIEKTNSADTAEAALQKVDDALEGHDDQFEDEARASLDYFNANSTYPEESIKNRFKKMLVNDVADIISDDEYRPAGLIPVSASE